MATTSHSAEDREGLSAGSDCGEPAGSGTLKARRVLFFVCAHENSVVGKTLERLKKRPPDPSVPVTVSYLRSLEAAQALAREDFCGQADRVVVVIDFDAKGRTPQESAAVATQLECAKVLACFYPVVAFFATQEGGQGEIAFKRAVSRAGFTLGRFDTNQIGTGQCALRVVYNQLASECSSS